MDVISGISAFIIQPFFTHQPLSLTLSKTAINSHSNQIKMGACPSQYQVWQEHLHPCQVPHISEDIKMTEEFSAKANPKHLAKYCYMNDDYNNLYEQNYRNVNWNKDITATKIEIMPATKVKNIEQKQKNWKRDDYHGKFIPPNDLWMNNPQRPLGACDPSSKEDFGEHQPYDEHPDDDPYKYFRY